LEYGAQGLAAGAMFGPWGAVIGGGIGAGYGAIKGSMEAKEMREKVRMANIGIGNRKLGRSMTSNVNWGTVNPNTSTNMMFANGGLVLDYDDPNANAELELQETFQMPDGTVGNVDGPSHEMGGIAVDLPEGTRIWSDKLKHNGKTFAKHTKPITNKIAKLEKQLESSNNPKAIENSIMLLNKQLDHYFNVQETNKQNNEMKKLNRKFPNGGTLGEDFVYDRWKRSLPENLQDESSNYNLRGYWESLGKPEKFQPFENELQEDGLYHASSRNPFTGEVLKGKLHPTLTQALDEDRKQGYYTTMKNRKLFTQNYRKGGLVKYDGGGEVAVGQINPKTGQPYTMEDI
ncbi:MAG: hypothetical protein ACK5XN_19840, partial [Bacteroidota bacterium]